MSDDEPSQDQPSDPQMPRRLRRGIAGSGLYPVPLAGDDAAESPQPRPTEPAPPPPPDDRSDPPLPDPPQDVPEQDVPAPPTEAAPDPTEPTGGDLQLIDGPPEHQGILSRAALLELVHSGVVAPTARAIDLGTMAPATAAALLGIADDRPAVAATNAGSGRTVAIELGERLGGDEAFERFEAVLAADGSPVLALRSGAQAPDNAVATFEDRMTAVQAIQHPSLRPVRAIERQDERLVIALAPVEGRELGGMLFGAPPPMDQVATWISQIAGALWAAAKAGIHHLALGPDWIVIGKNGVARISGFGSGPLITRSSSASHTRLLPYRAPEQLAGEAGDHRSDVYALAALTYHLLGAKPPFAGSDAQTLLASIEAGKPEPLSQRDQRIPQAVDAELFVALDPDPAQRPHSAMALARGLRAAFEQDAQGGASRSRSSSTITEESRERPSTTRANVVVGGEQRGRSPVAPLLVVAVLAALGAGGWFGWQQLADGAGDAAGPQDDPASAASRPPADDKPDPGQATRGERERPEAAAEPAAPPEEPAQPGMDRMDLLGAWQQAEDDGDWQQAHRLARSFALRFKHQVDAVRLRVPLVIASPTPGATILIDGLQLGQGEQVHRYAPGEDALIVVHAPGHRPAATSLRELHDQWQWRPELAPLSDLRWVGVLPSAPSASPAPLDDDRALIPLQGQAVAIYRLDGGNRYDLTLRDRGSLATGPLLRIRDHAFLVGSGSLTALDPKRAAIRWTRALVNDSATAGCTGPHELIPGQVKLWVVTADRQLRCIATSGPGANELKATPLPHPASAAPAVVMVGSAMSALAVPCGRQLLVFDGATVTPSSGAQQHFALDLGATISHSPTAFRHDDRPWLLIADDHQRVIAVDPRPGVDNRIAAEWYLPQPPACPPVRLGDGSRLAIITDGGEILGLDLERPGLVLWSHDTLSPPTGPPLYHRGRLYSLHQDGRLRILDAATGEARGEHRLGLELLGSPVIGDGHILVATAERVVLGLALTE